MDFKRIVCVTAGVTILPLLACDFGGKEEPKVKRALGEACDATNICDNGLMCMDNICHTICVVNGDCKEGQICRQNSCVDGSVPAVVDLGANCGDQVVCAHGSTCYNEVCRAICVADRDCQSGFACEKSICLPQNGAGQSALGGTCKNSAGCQDGLGCVQDKCRKICYNDGDCSSDEECYNTLCIAKQPVSILPANEGESCQKTGDCVSGLECIDSICQEPGLPPIQGVIVGLNESCDNITTICGAGLTCYDGICLKSCTTSSLHDCNTDKECRDNVCQDHQSNPPQLVDIVDLNESCDNITTICDVGLTCYDGICLKSCTTSSPHDCNTDKECRDNVCQDHQSNPPQAAEIVGLNEPCDNDTTTCNTGLTCYDGTCLKSCTTSSPLDCNTDQDCRDNVCQDHQSNPPQAAEIVGLKESCDNETTICDTGLTCYNGTCLVACTAPIARECNTDQDCNDNVCQDR